MVPGSMSPFDGRVIPVYIGIVLKCNALLPRHYHYHLQISVNLEVSLLMSVTIYRLA